jgi:hypothetical protein
MTLFKAEALNKPTAGSNGTFQSVLKEKIPEWLNCSIVLKNVHATASLKFQVLVSNDMEGAIGTYGALALDSEGNTTKSLAAGALEALTLSGPFAHVDLQIQSEDTNSPQCSAWMLAVG